MNTAVVSTKYQIVIPKELRRQLDIKAGQRLFLSKSAGGHITIKTEPDVASYVGILEAGNEDPVAYQQRIRQDKQYE